MLNHCWLKRIRNPLHNSSNAQFPAVINMRNKLYLIKINLITFNYHNMMEYANPHYILMSWYSQNTVKGMPEASILGEGVQTGLTVRTQPCPPPQLSVKISVVCILTNFAVNLSVARPLLISIFFDESSLQIVTDIYGNSQQSDCLTGTWT